MEPSKTDNKTIYPSPFDYIEDDGLYLVFDNQCQDSVSFIEGVDGLRIPKSYLSQCLRCRFQNEVDCEHDSDNTLDFLDELTEKIIRAFDKELDFFIQLQDDSIWYQYSYFADNDILKSFVAYVLKSELYKEYRRICSLISLVKAECDETDYDEKLKAAVANKEIGDEYFRRDQEAFNKLVERFSITQKQDESDE